MIVYTFRTFPHANYLKECVGNVFVFSRLKKDLTVLKEQLEQERPKYLIGVAETKGPSRVEPQAVNRFNKGTITKGGKDYLDLHVPQDTPFLTASTPTYTFCNWTMYQLQKVIDDKNYSTKLVFVHINAKDLGSLAHLLNNYSDSFFKT